MALDRKPMTSLENHWITFNEETVGELEAEVRECKRKGEAWRIR